MSPNLTIHTKGRALAIIAGCVFLAGTLAILFEDVLNGAPLALKHLITLVILSGTILAGHLASQARRDWRTWIAAFGFFLVFLSGTALVVYSSVGRQASMTTQVNASAEEINDRRAQIQKDRAKAQGMLDSALASFGKQCATGKGVRCDGIGATIDVYRAAVKGHDAELKEIGWSRPVNPEAEQFAEIIAAVIGLDAAAKGKVKAGALLAIPLLITLFLEFGTIQSFGYATRRIPAGQNKIAGAGGPPPSGGKLDAVQPALAPPMTQPLLAPAAAIDADTQAVLDALKGRQGALTNGELADKMGVVKSEASLRTTSAIKSGLVVRERRGREVYISLADAGQTVN